MKAWALLSVTDKTGLVDLAKGLSDKGYGLLSTGGTAKLLREAGLTVKDVAEHTGHPEALDGRVKTLHPKIHGGILFDRHNPAHAAQAKMLGIEPIDVVVVNLYRFADEAVAKGLAPEAAIEHIDVGGPAMLRAAAKNWEGVTTLVDPADYAEALAALNKNGFTAELNRKLAAKVFATTSAYDQMIAGYLARPTAPTDAVFPATLPLALAKVQDLRYGENPHQAAALYRPAGGAPRAFGAADILQGKELSYNNILDLDAATALVAEFEAPAVVIVKHTNPCGVASSRRDDMTMLYRKAFACDPKSAFGGIIALNRRVERDTAEAIAGQFVECVAAPEFSAEALRVFADKPNVRVLRADFGEEKRGINVRSVNGAFLVQQEDKGLRPRAEWQTVTRKVPDAATLDDLAFAMAVAKHVKSNAVVFAKDGVTVGIGAGQMSRIDSANTAVAKAKEAGFAMLGTVLASDAFFPFRDTVDFAAAHGVRAIIQPGGSKKDQDSIEAADQAGMTMVMTGERHFRH
jgi:phosphoribosylaminoimidazolecarboxamide formyltransferase/IMP cyclohydrolase